MASPTLETRYPEIDYDWRPSSYWDPLEDPLAALLANVKGSERRKLIWKHYQAGTLEELPKVLTEPELSEGMVGFVSSLGPSFMGGEFLPEYEEGEVEIARIALASTTGDVISVWATPVVAGISYRVVDEYSATFDFSPTESEAPLSLGELIDLIDSAVNLEDEECSSYGIALTTGIANYVHASDAPYASLEEMLEDARTMASLYSEYYASLGDHYDRIATDWYEAEKSELMKEGKL